MEIILENRRVRYGQQAITTPRFRSFLSTAAAAIRSNAEMRKLLGKKIVAQSGVCAICKEKFTDYSNIVENLDLESRAASAEPRPRIRTGKDIEVCPNRIRTEFS